MIYIRRGSLTQPSCRDKRWHVLGSVLDVWDTVVNEQDNKIPFLTELVFKCIKYTCIKCIK